MEDAYKTIAISLKNVSKTYIRSHLGRKYKTLGVKNISLEIFGNETFAIIGLNGSGKTTIIKLILGILKPDCGEIKILNFPLSTDLKKHIGYLPETPYFYRYLTAEEFLKFYGKISHMTQDQINSRMNYLFNLLKMEKHRKRKIQEFSKGMLQRIGIAQALIHNPSILILDEPVTGIDPIGVYEMREFLKELKKENKTILFSSHSISEVEKVSDRVAIICDGEIKKIVNNSQWQDNPGRLEEIFVSTVKDLAKPEQVIL